MRIKFGYTSFMKVVIPYIYFVQKFESHYLDQQNLIYDSNNRNYSSLGDYYDSMTSNSISGVLGQKFDLGLFKENVAKVLNFLTN